MWAWLRALITGRAAKRLPPDAAPSMAMDSDDAPDLSTPDYQAKLAATPVRRGHPKSTDPAPDPLEELLRIIGADDVPPPPIARRDGSRRKRPPRR